MVSHSRAAILLEIAATVAGIRCAGRISVQHKFIGVRQVSIVAKRKSKNGGRMSGADVGVFLSKVVLRIGVVGGLQLNLKAIVSRCGWSPPQHAGKSRTVRSPFHTQIDPGGTDRNTDRANTELQKRESDGHIHDWSFSGVIPDLCHDLVGGPRLEL